MEETQAKPSAVAWAPSMGSALGAFAIGGLVAVGIINSIHPVFEIVALAELPIDPSAEQMAEYLKVHVDYFGRNYAVYLAILGGLLGLAIGLVTTPGKRFLSAIAGISLGAISGAVAGYLGGTQTAGEIVRAADQSLVISSCLGFAVWAAIVTPICIAIGAIQGGASQAAKAAVAALIGCVLAVVAQVLVFALAFPATNLIRLVPETLPERLCWVAISGLVLGLMLSMGMKPETKKESPKAEAEV